MLYCYASEEAGDHVNGDTEFRLAIKQKKCLIYDWKQDVFRWGHDGTIVKLDNLNDKIMPFSEGVELLITKFDMDSLFAFSPTTDLTNPKQRKDAESLINRVLKSYHRNHVLGHINFIKIIEKHGGLCVINSNDAEVLESWPKYYQTRRNTKLLKGKELINTTPEQLLPYARKGDMGEMIFVKTARKNFAEYISIKDILNPFGVFYQLIVDSALDVDFIISEPAAIKKIELLLPYGIVDNVKQDNHVGCRYINAEYRCVIVNGELRNMSLCTDRVIHQVPQQAYDFALGVIEKMKKVSSTLETYSFDIMQFEDNSWDVIEFHTVTGLGCYLYNTLCTDMDSNNITGRDFKDECLHIDLSKLPLRVINDIREGKKKTTEITEWLDEEYDRSIEDRGYSTAYQSVKKNGLAMAYMLLRMVDTGIQPGLESVNLETRNDTKKSVVGFMECFGAKKEEIEKLVDSQEERLQHRSINPDEILKRVRYEEARLKSHYGDVIGIQMSDAWYVKEAMKLGIISDKTVEKLPKTHKKVLK